MICFSSSLFLWKRLLSSVGQELEDATNRKLRAGPKPGISKLSVYIKEMQTLVGDKRISLRVRKLLQVKHFWGYLSGFNIWLVHHIDYNVAYRLTHRTSVSEYPPMWVGVGQIIKYLNMGDSNQNITIFTKENIWINAVQYSNILEFKLSCIWRLFHSLK